LAFKEQKPKNHKNIEQKPQKKKIRHITRSSQARRNAKRRREKRDLKEKKLYE
jgi:hypothetical protein